MREANSLEKTNIDDGELGKGMENWSSRELIWKLGLSYLGTREKKRDKRAKKIKKPS